MEDHNKFMKEAIKEAKLSLKESGIPIGAVLVTGGEIISRGHNRLLQNGSVILHAEMDCMEKAGRRDDYQNTLLYTTLSPCDMCSGMILLHKIPVVVMGENKTLKGPEKYLTQNGVKLINLDMDECRDMMEKFIRDSPQIWKKELKRVGFQ